MIYFTSDNHFFHELAAKNRGFENTDQMNEKMIAVWNATVNATDHIFIIGDFAIDRRGGNVENLLSKLNGKKTLILGNHDHWGNERMLPNIQGLFQEVCHYKEIKYQKIKFILFHYPIREWNFKRFNSIHLHGHQHITRYTVENMLNVAADLHEFRPIAIDEVLVRLNRNNIKMCIISMLEKLKEDGKLKSTLLSILGLTHFMSSSEEPVKKELIRQIQSFIDNFKNYKLTKEMMTVLAINQIEEAQFHDLMSNLIMCLDHMNSLIKKCLEEASFIDMATVNAFTELTEEIEQYVANLYKLFSEECSLIEQNNYDFDEYVNVRAVLEEFVEEIFDTLDYLDAMADFKSTLESQTISAYISKVKSYLVNIMTQYRPNEDTLSLDALKKCEMQELFSALVQVILLDEN